MKRSEFLRLGLLAIISSAVPIGSGAGLFAEKPLPEFLYYSFKVSASMLKDEAAWQSTYNQQLKKFDHLKFVNMNIGWVNYDLVTNLFTCVIKFEKI